MDVRQLPGAELIEEGLRDLATGHETDAAWLVLIGAPRLRCLGLAVPFPRVDWLAPPHEVSPEHRLYERLARSNADSAHSRYNASIRLLVSFE